MSEHSVRRAINNALWRARTLITGRTEWVDQQTGEVDVDRSRKVAFLVAGTHSRNWKWVQRFGAMPCGCTRNPLTRRLLLINGRCPTHSIDDLRRRLEQSDLTTDQTTPRRTIVISTTHDGYGLSEEAVAVLRARGHADPESLPRDHPDLVDVVRTFGEAAGGVNPWAGERARLSLIQIPADVDHWVINSYDGIEWVAEAHRRWDARGLVPPHQGTAEQHLFRDGDDPVAGEE